MHDGASPTAHAEARAPATDRTTPLRAVARAVQTRDFLFYDFSFYSYFCALVSGAQPPSVGRVSRAAALSGPQDGLRPLYGILPSQYALRVILLTERGIYMGRRGGIQRPSVRALGDLVDRAADRACHLGCEHAGGPSAARVRIVHARGWDAYPVHAVHGALGQAALRLWYVQYAGGWYA